MWSAHFARSRVSPQLIECVMRCMSAIVPRGIRRIEWATHLLRRRVAHHDFAACAQVLRAAPHMRICLHTRVALLRPWSSSFGFSWRPWQRRAFVRMWSQMASAAIGSASGDSDDGDCAPPPRGGGWASLARQMDDSSSEEETTIVEHGQAEPPEDRPTSEPAPVQQSGWASLCADAIDDTNDEAGEESDAPTECEPIVAIRRVLSEDDVVGGPRSGKPQPRSALTRGVQRLLRLFVPRAQGPPQDEVGEASDNDEGVEITFAGETRLLTHKDVRSMVLPTSSLVPALREADGLAQEYWGKLEYFHDGALTVSRHLFTSKTSLMSNTASGQHLGVARRALPELQCLAAAAGVALERADCVRVIEKLIAFVQGSNGRCIALIEHPRYDETPMPVRVRDTYARTGAPSELSAGDKKAMPLCGKQSAEGVAKILNTEWKYAALFFLGGKYYSFLFRTTQWLQLLSRTTGECYYDALCRSRLPLGHLQHHFDACYRVAVNDSDAAVAKAERGHEKACNQMHLTLKCIIHKTANIREQLFKMVPSFVSGLIAFALCLRTATAFQEFKDSVREALQAPGQVDFKAGFLAPASQRKAVSSILDIFAPMSITKNRLRRVVISSLANGGVADGRILHYESSCGFCNSREDCMKKMCTSFVAALLPARLKSFPGRNWINNEDVIDCLGLLHFFGLLRPAFAMFLAKSGTSLPNPVGGGGSMPAGHAGDDIAAPNMSDWAHSWAGAASGPAVEGRTSAHRGHQNRHLSAELQPSTAPPSAMFVRLSAGKAKPVSFAFVLWQSTF